MLDALKKRDEQEYIDRRFRDSERFCVERMDRFERRLSELERKEFPERYQQFPVPTNLCSG